ncbi:MAG: hypothetical protein PHQ58_22295 [Rhodoferax sp.]|nr:hypothetical protein [Rhodoferax sp.]MDD2883151.1 hypothetical protein [Rhodoferax sp.]
MIFPSPNANTWQTSSVELDQGGAVGGFEGLDAGGEGLLEG